MNNFKYKFNNWRYNQALKFQQFMVGRYGIDELYRFTNTLIWIFIVLSLFIRKPIMSIITFALIIFSYFRAFSKNYAKRYKENQIYLNYSKGIRSFVKLQIRRFKERKNYRFRKCTHCKKVLRLPNKKGKHTVNCPNCHQYFDVKI